MNTMREAFEAFALARNCPPSALLPLEDGTYRQDGTLAGMWAAWQAATLAERERCAKVCEDQPVPASFSLTAKTAWHVATIECASAIRKGEE